jgi:hypothetical protein
LYRSDRLADEQEIVINLEDGSYVIQFDAGVSIVDDATGSIFFREKEGSVAIAAENADIMIIDVNNNIK